MPAQPATVTGRCAPRTKKELTADANWPTFCAGRAAFPDAAMKLHAFVAMPFGIKPDHAGRTIDFDRVYADLIRPALEAAGFEAFRADEELRAGDIRTDMFQELLVADLVVADLTLDNPNVWYELGVRHALRARGVVLIQGPRPTQPFDIYTDRKLRYRLTEDGVPDPVSLEADRTLLARMARQTLDASTARTVSPVYALLRELREPPWRELLLAQRNEFSQVYEAWKSRMEVARQKNRPGDILVLADETPTQSLWLEARARGGRLPDEAEAFRLCARAVRGGARRRSAEQAEPREEGGMPRAARAHRGSARMGAPAHRRLRIRSRRLGARGACGKRRVDPALAAIRREAGRNARRGSGRGSEPARRDRALLQGVHRRPVALPIRHQRPHADPSAETPGRATRRDRDRAI